MGYLDESIARIVLQPKRLLACALYDTSSGESAAGSGSSDPGRRCYATLFDGSDDEEGEALTAKVGLTLFSAEEDAPIAAEIAVLKRAAEEKESERSRMEEHDADGEQEADDALEAQIEEPWLSSTGNGRSGSSEPWSAEDGFDVYVDGARGLPHQLCTCRIGMKLLKMNRKTIVGKEHTFEFDLKSPWRYPNCLGAGEGTNVAEYHETDTAYTPETTLMMRLDALTIDGAWCAVGYAAIHPFVQVRAVLQCLHAFEVGHLATGGRRSSLLKMC
jgi:hypothetical protein